jgi:hypothetical protein
MKRVSIHPLFPAPDRMPVHHFQTLNDIFSIFSHQVKVFASDSFVS